MNPKAFLSVVQMLQSVLVASAYFHELLRLFNLSMGEESDVIKYSRRVGEKEKMWCN